jgi:hypothetical protein
MASCEFEEDPRPAVRGTTLYPTKGSKCMKETAVYLPPGHDFLAKKLHVVLWIHGYYVHNVRDLLEPADSDMDMYLRQNVISTKKDVVLIAPWLGYRYLGGGSLGLGDLGKGNGCQLYLDEVLKALGRFRKAYAAKSGGRTETGDTNDADDSAPPTIENLVAAGHSAGGAMMRDFVAALGNYRSALNECWGFDCLYDDLWPGWVVNSSLADVKIYMYFAKGIRGSRVIDLWTKTYGTLKNPKNIRPRNVFMTPSINVLGTLVDRTAFQTSEEIQKKTALDDYERARKEADPLLDSRKPADYWSKLSPKLKGHFEVVADVFGPRIAQSAAL